MANWLPSQHNGLHFDITFLNMHIKDHGSRGEINNSAKVMDTCRQQSTVNGIEVTLVSLMGKILILLFLIS